MKIKSNRKAVAPIIATLLMVAIAVVGGILIFVFTQGFFADDQVVGPTVDNIRIFGYDASNIAEVDNYDGQILSGCTGVTTGNDLRAGDCVTIYISNLGDKPVAIQSIRIFGETMTVGSVNTSGGTCPTTNGQFVMLDGENAVISILEPNADAGLCFKYAGNTSNVKPGRTIPIQVETANGQSSQVNIINGALRGQLATVGEL